MITSMSSVRTTSVDWRGANRLTQCRPSPHRRAEPPRGRQHRALARVGTPLRTALPESHGGRVPALRRRPPGRTAGGFRLYADADEQRVRRMLRHLEAGVSAAEGARLALLESADPVPGAAP